MASPLPLTQSSETDMHAPLTGFLRLFETRLNRINIWAKRDKGNYSFRCHHVWLSAYKWWRRLSLLFYENSYFFPFANTRFALLHTHVRVTSIRDIHFSTWLGDDEKNYGFIQIYWSVRLYLKLLSELWIYCFACVSHTSCIVYAAAAAQFSCIVSCTFFAYLDRTAFILIQFFSRI